MTVVHQDDETLLRRYAEERSQDLRELLVERYENFAGALASRFSGRRDDADDIRQVAMIALVKALDRFDPNAGVAFTTFAWATIHGELKRFQRDHTWAVRVPRSLQERYLRVHATVEEMSSQLGRSPRIDEIAASLELSNEEVIEAIDLGEARTAVSIDAEPDDGFTPAANALAVRDAGIAGAELRADLQELLSILPAREQEIIRLRFIEDLTQAEIGQKLGISQMHVSRLLRQSVERLRQRAEPRTEPRASPA